MQGVPYFKVYAMSKILRLPQVIQKTGLSRSTIYSLINSGDFPKRIKLTSRSMGFLEEELDSWLKARVEKDTGGAL
jgi:prophage regulatory protein